MDPPPTRYLDRDGVALAYQHVGDGADNVVGYMSIVQHLDLCWTDPHIHYNFERVAGFARAVYFQRRGLGLSESVRYVPSMEQQAEDILAVMDAVDMRRATLLATVDTCAPAALVAALAPERVSGLVMLTPFSRGWYGEGELPVGWTRAEADDYLTRTRASTDTWGSGATVGYWDPMLDTPFNRRLMALLERCSATPAAARAHLEAVLRYDMTDVLRAVQVPTRVLRIPSNRVPDAAVRYVAELIPNASYHLLAPTVRGASLGESFLPVIEHVEEMVTGHAHAADADRSLGTVLFTDVVDSTGLLSQLGDARYRELRAAHERDVRLSVEQAGGRLVKVTGDGTLSLFDSPSRAVRCAETIRAAADGLGIAVRAGLHAGEVEHEGPDVAGMAVHIGARVAATAGAGQVLATRTVHDLVAGARLSFTSSGVRELKGVPGTWELFALSTAAQQRETLPEEPSLQTSLDRAALSTARHAPRAARTLVRVGNAIQRRRVGER